MGDARSRFDRGRGLLWEDNACNTAWSRCGSGCGAGCSQTWLPDVWLKDPRVAITCGADARPATALEIDGNAAGFTEARAVQLEPAGCAGGGQAAVAHNDVGACAQFDQRCPGEPHPAVGCDDEPVSRPAVDQRRAHVAAAPGVWSLTQGEPGGTVLRRFCWSAVRSCSADTAPVDSRAGAVISPSPADCASTSRT